MEEKIKLRGSQIVLFYKNEVEFNTLELATSIAKRMPQIGQPNIFNLQPNVPDEVRLQAPRIVFEGAKDIKIQVSITNLNLTIIEEKSEEEREKYAIYLFEALKEQGIEVQSVGTVYDYIDMDANFEKIKKTYLSEELQNSDLANFSWYKQENHLNTWKMVKVADKDLKKVLEVRLDINNRGNIEPMTEETIKQMINNSYEESMNFKKEINEKMN